MPLSLPRNSHLWLPGLLSARLRRNHRPTSEPTEILFCIADHFEPAHGDPGVHVERARVAAWVERFPRLAQQFTDSSGRHPQHTFFFPEEGYRPDLLDELATLHRRGFGDVEIHLHHDSDTGDRLRDRLERFKTVLFNRHGLLRLDRKGNITFGFVHGNWALDNARPDGKWCGVNNEITVLRESGCYADFTLPAAPDPAQTRTVNSIYYAVDDPARPRSHEFGPAAKVGQQGPENGLLIIQGPLGFDWRRRVWVIFPGLENGALDSSGAHLPSLERFVTWVRAAVGVEGRPEWVFVKVYTHGAPDDNAAVLLGSVMERFHAEINRAFNDGRRYRLHYVTAFEMATLVKAAEAGLSGNPQELLRSPVV